MIVKKKLCGKSNESCCVVFLFIFLLTISACQSNTRSSSRSVASVPAANDDYFQEIGKEIGLDFVHSIGDNELSNIVESSGAGAAFLDYDQDGYIDLYVCSGTWIKDLSSGNKPEVMSQNHLYRNLGNGTFEDVTKRAGVGGPWYSMGVTVGDYNNDGYPDLYVSNYGTNVLYKNNGNGTFTDVTSRAKVAGKETDFNTGAVWLDYDNDGFLDLYVGKYLSFDPDYKYYYAPDGFPGPMAYDAQPDILYHNNGDGTFEDVTKAMGIKDVDGRAMGVGAADIDDDGFVDIFVANDHSMNYLWHNNNGKSFTDIGTSSGTAFGQTGLSTISMAVDFDDYNGDGLTDIFVSDDKYCSLFENIGKGKFKDVSKESGKYFMQKFVGRGACFGDYDNDGDIDAYIVNLNDRGSFLRNNKGNQNNWIILNLVGTTSNRDGIGTRVKVTSGGKVQTTQKKSTTGYLSQNDPRMHFGLAKNEMVERIEIKWPSGKLQVLENIKANQILTVKEP